MKRLVTMLLLMMCALCVFACSVETADEGDKDFGEHQQLLCTAEPIAFGSAGCTAGKQCGTVHSITGIRGKSTNYERFQLYRNGAWEDATDFDQTSWGGPSVGPTGLMIVGEIGGAGYPPITKVIFTNETYWCTLPNGQPGGCPGTSIRAESFSNPEMFYDETVAIHGGWVTCQQPPCNVDFGSTNSLGKKFTRMAATGNGGHFKLSGVGSPGVVEKEFAIDNSCTP